MKVNSINCQPIRQYSSTPAFCSSPQGAVQEADSFSDLEQEKKEWEKVANNKDSKMLSTLGTIAVSAIAATISFCTFKTVAPKGFEVLKNLYTKIAGSSIVSKSVNGIKSVAKGAGNKAAELWKSIPAEGTMGKIKGKTDKLASTISDKVSPILGKAKTAVIEFAKKHNLNKAWLKEALLTGGGIAAAFPAAVTAANPRIAEKADEDIEGGED